VKTRAVIALSALVASGFTAAASAAPKKIPACASFTDAAGDDKMADGGQFEDKALDIVKVVESVKGNTFSVAITVTKYGLPQYADGARYQAGFMYGGKLVELYGTNSRSKPVVEQAYALRGIRIDDAYVSGTEEQVTVTEDPATNTITLSTPLSSLGTAAGAKLGGVTATGLQATIYGVYTQLLEPWDDAAAPPSTKLTMSECT
jgi:hypothetical protein